MAACVIAVRAVPNASRTQVVGMLGDAVKVKLKAVPEGGRANEELLEFFAEKLGLGRRAVTLVSGATSREKRVAVAGMDVGEALRRLGAG